MVEVKILSKSKNIRLHTEEELKKHKKGKEYVARKLAEQDRLKDYDQMDVDDIPEHLDYLGKKEWKRITPLLKELPIAELDKEMLESYCTLHSSRRMLEKDIQEKGMTFSVMDREGNEVIRRNPSYEMLVNTIKEQRMIAGKLGMTMSSRLELAEPEKEKEEDEFVKLLKGS